MARLWTCGFELRSATGGLEVDTVTGTAPTISTTTVRGGSAAMRFNPTAATSFVTHRFAVNAIRYQAVRMAIRFASFPTSDTDIFQWYDGSSGFPSVRFFSGTQKLQVRDGASGLVGSASATLALNTWYVLQMSFDDSASDVVNAYLDGVQFCTNGNGGDIGGLGQVRFGLITATTGDMFVDDVAVNDNTGTADTGLPTRDARVTILNATAAGDNNLWPTAVGGTAGTANNFTRVSDLPPDDATTYNQLAATGTTQIDDVNVTDATAAGIGAGDTVSFVAVGIRVGSTTTTAASVVSRLKGQAAGTTTESASLSTAINGFRTGGVVAASNPQPSHNILAYVNPQTSAAWTASAVDNVQIGYRANVSQTSTRRVTKVWALVEYVPSAGTSATTTPATVVGLVAITGTVQAGAGAAPSTIAGAATLSGTTSLSILAGPATVAGSTSISAVILAGSTAAPGAITPPAVVIAAGVLTGSVAAAGTIAGATAISAIAQASATAAPATIAPPKVAITGTVQVGSTAGAGTIAPPKVSISGSAETSSTSVVPASTISPPRVAITGTVAAASTTAAGTIAPPPVAISGAAQASRTAAVVTIAGAVTISGTGQAGTAAAAGTIAPSAVALGGAAQAGAGAATATILGATVIAAGTLSSSTAAAGTISPPAVVITGAAQTASGVTANAATILGTAAIGGAPAISQAAGPATILGATALAGTAWVGSTARPATILGSVDIGPHAAAGSSGSVPAAGTIAGVAVITGTGRAGATAVVVTIAAPVALPPVLVRLSAGPATILGAVAIGPHSLIRAGTALAATILGAVAMPLPHILSGYVVPGDPVVTADAIPAAVIGDPNYGAVTGDALARSVTGDPIRAGVS